MIPQTLSHIIRRTFLLTTLNHGKGDIAIIASEFTFFVQSGTMLLCLLFQLMVTDMMKNMSMETIVHQVSLGSLGRATDLKTF